MTFVKNQTTSYQEPLQKSCSICGRPTSHDTLAVLGARCQPCFKAYCEQVPEVRSYPPGLIPEGNMAWAHRLKWRHSQGEKLSSPQIEKYKQALRIK